MCYFCHQYDQKQLQALRQKSLLLSNRRDGCLYLFLKKFLVRISLRGTVTVTADLLEFALAAAGRLCSSKTTGVTSSLTAGITGQAQQLGAEEACNGSGRTPTHRLSSLRHFCQELGYEENGSFSTATGGIIACCGDHSPFSGELFSSVQVEGSPASPPPGMHAEENIRQLHDRLLKCGSGAYFGVSGSIVAARREEFLASRGESWEVNNCCIDGEGRCFYTVAHMNALSPVQQRGKLRACGCFLSHRRCIGVTTDP